MPSINAPEHIRRSLKPPRRKRTLGERSQPNVVSKSILVILLIGENFDYEA